MRSARRGAAVGAVLAVAAALSACGGGTPGTGPGDAGSPTPAENLNALLPGEIRESGVIALATDPNYPPCQFFEEGSDTMIGFEVDLWDAVGEALGVEVRPEATTFDNLIPGVQSGRYEVAMECITDNPEREEIVNLVGYAVTKGAIFTLEENRHGISEDPLTLCGLRLAVQSGMDQIATAENILTPHCKKAGQPPIDVKRFPSASQTILALHSERADFIITDLAAGVHMEKSAPKPLTHFENELLPSFYWAAVINKENTELTDAFIAGFQEIMDNGRYAEIMEKWGIPELAIDEAGLNLATARPRPIPTP